MQCSFTQEAITHLVMTTIITFLWPGLLSGFMWISACEPHKPVTSPSSKSNDEAMSKTDTTPAEWTLVLSGIFDSAGTSLVKISKPIVYHRPLEYPTPNQVKGKFKAIVFYSSADSLVVHFDALVAGDKPVQGSQHGFFELQIPLKDRNISSIHIIASHPEKQFAHFTRNDIIYQ